MFELVFCVLSVADKMHFWTCGDPYCYGWRSRYCRHRQGTVEATAYAMLAYLEMGQLADARLIETWLVSQMDSKGGYRSTQVRSSEMPF